MKIDKIIIENFKSIRKQAIKVDNINVLIGPNGVGKSNFVLFFKLLNNIIEKRLQSFVIENGGSNGLLYFGNKVSKYIYFKVEFGENEYYATLSPTIEQNLFFENEKVAYINYMYGQRYDYDIGNGNKETGLFERIKLDKTKKPAWYVAEAMKTWRVYHFHDTSSSSPIKQPSDINDNRFFRPNASNLASYLYFLKNKHEQYFNRIQDTIRLIAPYFKEFDLKPSQLYNNKIVLEWKHIGSDQYFDANHLSDGTLRMICLITLLLQPNLPHTILIDEPELGLHPAAITLLASLIKSSSLKSQVICSTQSVTLLNRFDAKDIIVVNRENNESVFKRLNENELTEWLDNYSVGELWEKNVLGGRP